MSREQRTRHRLLDESGDFSDDSIFTPYADEVLAVAGETWIGDLLDKDSMPSAELEPVESLCGRPGYVYFPRDFELSPDLYVDGQYDPHANDVTEATLQRETRVSGGGGSRSVGAPRKKRSPRPSAVMRIVDERENRPTVPMHITGLTAGERHVLHDDRFRIGRYSLARTILIEAVAYIRFHREFPPTRNLARTRTARYELQIYGLTELQIKLLRVFEGRSLRVLVREAHRRHRETIRAIDGDRARGIESFAMHETPKRSLPTLGSLGVA